MEINFKQSGMTLIQVLVSVSIIAILVSVMYSLVKQSEKDEKEQKTSATITLLDTALEQYYQQYREFPDPNADDRFDPDNFYPDDVDDTDPNNAEKLYYCLSLCPEAKAILNKIDPAMVQNTDNDDWLEYIDAWGNEFRYEYDFGDKSNNYKYKDNFPKITSFGSDGVYDGSKGEDKDNITNQQ